MMMSRRRVCFSPEANTYANHGGESKKAAAAAAATMKLWMFKVPRGSSVGSMIKNIGEKVARALPAAAGRRRRSCKVSSAASLGRSRSYAETLDSHRAEAIEDCIEFFNSSSSSSSLQRSNSVSSSCS